MKTRKVTFLRTTLTIPREKIYTKALFDSDDNNHSSLGLLEYRVSSARGHDSRQRSKLGRPNKPNTDGMSEQEALFALLHWQAS